MHTRNFFEAALESEDVQRPLYLKLSEDEVSKETLAEIQKAYGAKPMRVMQEILKGYPKGADILYAIEPTDCRLVHAGLVGLHSTTDPDEAAKIFNYLRHHYLDRQQDHRPLLMNPQLAQLMQNGFRRVVERKINAEVDARLRLEACACLAYQKFVKKLAYMSGDLAELREFINKVLWTYCVKYEVPLTADEIENCRQLSKRFSFRSVEKALEKYGKDALVKCLDYMDSLHSGGSTKEDWIMHRDMLVGLFPEIFRFCPNDMLRTQVDRTADQISSIVDRNATDKHQDFCSLMPLMLAPRGILDSLCQLMDGRELSNKIVPIVWALFSRSIDEAIYLFPDRPDQERVKIAKELAKWIRTALSSENITQDIWVEDMGKRIERYLNGVPSKIKGPESAKNARRNFGAPIDDDFDENFKNTKEILSKLVDGCYRGKRSCCDIQGEIWATEAGIVPSRMVRLGEVSIVSFGTRHGDRDRKTGAVLKLKTGVLDIHYKNDIPHGLRKSESFSEFTNYKLVYRKNQNETAEYEFTLARVPRLHKKDLEKQKEFRGPYELKEGTYICVKF